MINYITGAARPGLSHVWEGVGFFVTSELLLLALSVPSSSTLSSLPFRCVAYKEAK